MQLDKALKIAETTVKILKPHCEKIEIAGSIRRRKADVKDIEIVCLPKRKTMLDIFNEPDYSLISNDFINTVLALGRPLMGYPAGRYMQIVLPEDIKLDLFMPEADDYYRQLAIRTGSSGYSAGVIAAGWKRLGWCGSDKGLRLITDCQETKGTDGKSKWKCTNPHAERPPVWQSEREFFAWLGIEWITPEKRYLPKAPIELSPGHDN